MHAGRCVPVTVGLAAIALMCGACTAGRASKQSAIEPTSPGSSSSSQSTAAISASTLTPVVSPTSATTTAAVSTAAVSSATPALVAGAACLGTQLTVSFSPRDFGVGGHTGGLFEFTNPSATPCTLIGYPGVALVNRSGQQQFQAVRTLAGYLGGSTKPAPQTVTLAARGGVASALLETVDRNNDPNGSACGESTAVLVTIPNTTTTRTFPETSVPLCAAPEIHPVVAGTTGRN
jgi:hypothetical protein